MYAIVLPTPIRCPLGGSEAHLFLADKERDYLEPAAKSRYLLTESGYQKLHEELETVLKRRTQAAEAIRTAKSFGDLSENFEYHEAKREAGFLEGRILELKEILPTAQVVTPDQVESDTVGFGARVTLFDHSLDEEWDCYIVGPLEADPENDRISYEAPLGAALMERRVGDEVEVDTPGGRHRYEIRGIHPYE